MDRTDLQHDAFTINGMYLEDTIPGYMTYKASGRESLQKKIDSYENGTDGETIRRTNFPVRSIEISFVVKGSSLADMRRKMHELQTALNVENAEIVFNDDPGCYYTATPVMEENVSEAHNAVLGTYKLVCHDPFKYSKTLTVVNTSTYTETETDEEGSTHQVTSQVLTTDNDGGYKTFPVFTVKFATDENASGAMGSNADCGYVLFSKGGTDYSVQIGDDQEKDTTTTTVVSQDFKTSKGPFSASNSTPSPFTSHQFQGSIKAETNASKGQGLKSSSYGTAASGKYFGPLAVYDIGRNLTGAFAFSWKEVVACAKDTATGKKQSGSFWVFMLNNNNELVFGTGINKKSKTTLNADFSWYTPGTGLESVQTASLKYTSLSGFKKDTDTAGRQSTCSIKRKYDADLECWVTEFKAPNVDKKSLDSEAFAIRKVAFFFGKYGSSDALFTNRVVSAKLVDGDYDAVNTFGSEDIAEVDCGKAEIILNDVRKDSLGDVGNNWEDMYLDVGINTIYVQYSDWVVSGYEPTIVMTYRKRWL